MSYRRQKTKTMALLHFGEEVAGLLRQLPKPGPLFPYLRGVRAAEFAAVFPGVCACGSGQTTRRSGPLALETRSHFPSLAGSFRCDNGSASCCSRATINWTACGGWARMNFCTLQGMARKDTKFPSRFTTTFTSSFLGKMGATVTGPTTGSGGIVRSWRQLACDPVKRAG